MKQSVIPLVITGVLAVAAGVAIAGLPSTPPGDDLVITELPTTTTTTLVIVPDTVAPLPTTTTTTLPDPVPTSIGINLAPTTIPEPTPLVPREELAVASANAAGENGIATAIADLLTNAGYVGVVPLDSVTLVEVSAVYHPPELRAEAVRLAADLGWGFGAVAPIAELPELSQPGEFDLVAVVGLDRVPVDDL